MQDKQKTIFSQLILNVIIPTLLALMVMAFINFTNTKTLIQSSNNEKNRIISNEITEVLELQELAVSIIEKSMSERMRSISARLVDDFYYNTLNIKDVDLQKISSEVSLDPDMEDIYIIDTCGLIVNTTFEPDLGFNLYDLGEDHENHLRHVFDTGVFVNTRFAIEASTKKPRKYTYQATNDRNFIVEIGAYSEDANEVLNNIERIKTDIISDNIGITDLEIFFMADTIFSLNNKAHLYNQADLLAQTFARKDTVSIAEKSGSQWYHYQYLYMPRLNSQLYRGSVIRIVSDRTSEKMLLRRELMKFILLFAMTIFVVSALIYRKTRVITSPIKKLVDNVDRITGGHLSERAEVEGNNEITRLSQKFNMMIDELEKYYNELEQMVKDRTAKIEEQKRHIMDSIYYARRIQTAILPANEHINSYLENSFILYRPKDIVSGDFYWFYKTKDQVMISAVDCTGHGVPGAFMSIVGYNQLNYAVNVKKATRSDDILNNLNEGVIETLSSESTHESKVMDGMDLALCVFDNELKNLQYSGANNPLILIRDNELIQYRADKFPIGAYEGQLQQLFTRVEIPLKKGDCLYIFSDGYPDQFGGPRDKKLTTKKFKQLLLDIHNEPMEKQKELLNNSLEEWMGEGEQIDDILVIGIKV